MAATKKGSKDPETPQAVESSPPAEAGAGSDAASAVPVDVTVPVEGTAVAGTTTPAPAKPAKAAKPEIPEHLKKGNRVCASCNTPEADFLAKNPRYSLCQGVDVLCYRKGDRVVYNQTIEQVNEKYPDKVGKVDDKQRPLIQAVSGIGIKPGILVRGAIKYSRKSTDTAATGTGAPTPAETSTTATPVAATGEGATGSVGATSSS